MRFALTILGINAAAPAYGRHPSAQVLQVHNRHYLIDCGEGTQMRMSDFNIPRHKINQVFISHLHGDHVFGLPGLLFSFSLMDRKAPLHLYSPAGLREMILAQLTPSGALSYPLHFHEVNTASTSIIFEDPLLSVTAIPLRHRIPTIGFLFREKPRPLNIIPEKIETYHLTIEQIKAAKAGEDITLSDGRTIPNMELTLSPPPPRSYAYMSDTMFDESVVPHIHNTDLLFHETTFCEDHADNATLTHHSTARQAALIAKAANVRTLITGHYSSRYPDVQPFLDEARAVFPNSVAGEEGRVYEVPIGA